MDRGTVWATNSGEVEKYGTRLREASPDRISQDVDNHWPFISLLVKFYDTSSKATELGICPFTGQSEEIRSYFRLRIPLSSQKTLRELLVLETW
ncbi:hypothetical protein POPTR_008G059301v4 [Populus trichocarpa]|uniref:Uncharacterized protein n=1 Tax=Populus trichocarpa TaxID=3694 RepID=A0A2K1ZCJ8_POPTR|nr:hypothetical protein POPTR_008G059301v4 [Populus trichocarpa]